MSNERGEKGYKTLIFCWKFFFRVAEAGVSPERGQDEKGEKLFQCKSYCVYTNT